MKKTLLLSAVTLVTLGISSISYGECRDSGDWVCFKPLEDLTYDKEPDASCMEMICSQGCVENIKTGDGACCPVPTEDTNCQTDTENEYNEKGCLVKKKKECTWGECRADGSCGCPNNGVLSKKSDEVCCYNGYRWTKENNDYMTIDADACGCPKGAKAYTKLDATKDCCYSKTEVLVSVPDSSGQVCCFKETPYWSGSKCVECTDDSHCEGREDGKTLCIDNVCKGCISNDDCANRTDGKIYCDNTVQKCINKCEKLMLEAGYDPDNFTVDGTIIKWKNKTDLGKITKEWTGCITLTSTWKGHWIVNKNLDLTGCSIEMPKTSMLEISSNKSLKVDNITTGFVNNYGTLTANNIDAQGVYIYKNSTLTATNINADYSGGIQKYNWGAVYVWGTLKADKVYARTSSKNVWNDPWSGLKTCPDSTVAVVCDYCAFSGSNAKVKKLDRRDNGKAAACCAGRPRTSSSGPVDPKIECKPGTYFENGKCWECTPGYYCPDGINMIKCPTNKVSAPGETSCHSCGICWPDAHPAYQQSACYLEPRGEDHKRRHQNDAPVDYRKKGKGIPYITYYGYVYMCNS